MQLRNKHCLITGGTAGIGLALAQQLTERGARVTLCGRDSARLDAALSQLPDAIGVVADVALVDGRQRLADTVLESGGLDLLINNAGVQFRRDFIEQTPERAERELLVNLLGPVLLALELLPQLQERGGTLANVTSGLAYAPAHDACVYSASKAGLQSFTRALRPSAAARGVRVVEVIPPLVATELTAGRDRRKMATPEEVARAITTGLIEEVPCIAVGMARLVPLLARVAPSFLERRMNAS